MLHRLENSSKHAITTSDVTESVKTKESNSQSLPMNPGTLEKLPNKLRKIKCRQILISPDGLTVIFQFKVP